MGICCDKSTPESNIKNEKKLDALDQQLTQQKRAIVKNHNHDVSKTTDSVTHITRAKVDIPAPKSKSSFKAKKMSDAYSTYYQSFPFFKYNCTDIYVILAKSATEAFGGTADQDGTETENNSNVNAIIEAICSDENGAK